MIFLDHCCLTKIKIKTISGGFAIKETLKILFFVKYFWLCIAISSPANFQFRVRYKDYATSSLYYYLL